MKTWIVKLLMRTFSFLFVLALTVSSAWAVININQDTFILSDEGGGLITKLNNAGYGDSNLYQALVDIVANTNPSVSGIIFPAFLAALKTCPPGAEIFTTLLKNIPTGTSVAISTDGTARTTALHGADYYNKAGTATLPSNISGVGNAYFVNSTIATPLTSWTVNGPLSGMTTTYNVFAIGWAGGQLIYLPIIIR
jgi:hypothetical protein